MECKYLSGLSCLLFVKIAGLYLVFFVGLILHL